MEFSNSDFDSVAISGIDNYEIVLGRDYSVSVLADESIIEKVEIKQAGSALSVSLPDSYKYTAQMLKAVIELPSIDNLSVTAKSNGIIIGDAADVEIDDFSINTAILDMQNESEGTVKFKEGEAVEVRAYTEVKLSGESELNISAEGDVNDNNVDDNSDMYYI